MTNFEAELIDHLKVLSIHLSIIATVQVKYSPLSPTIKDGLLQIIEKAQSAITEKKECPWTNKEQSK